MRRNTNYFDFLFGIKMFFFFDPTPTIPCCTPEDELAVQTEAGMTTDPAFNSSLKGEDAT